MIYSLAFKSISAHCLRGGIKYCCNMKMTWRWSSSHLLRMEDMYGTPRTMYSTLDKEFGYWEGFAGMKVLRLDRVKWLDQENQYFLLLGKKVCCIFFNQELPWSRSRCVTNNDVTFTHFSEAASRSSIFWVFAVSWEHPCLKISTSSTFESWKMTRRCFSNHLLMKADIFDSSRIEFGLWTQRILHGNEHITAGLGTIIESRVQKIGLFGIKEVEFYPPHSGKRCVWSIWLFLLGNTMKNLSLLLTAAMSTSLVTWTTAHFTGLLSPDLQLWLCCGVTSAEPSSPATVMMINVSSTTTLHLR